MAMASSTVSNTTKVANGPNTSSWAMRAELEGASTAVGCMK